MSFFKNLIDGLIAADNVVTALEASGVNVDRLIHISNAQGEIAKHVRKVMLSTKPHAVGLSSSQIDDNTLELARNPPTVKQLVGPRTPSRSSQSKKRKTSSKK